MKSTIRRSGDSDTRLGVCSSMASAKPSRSSKGSGRRSPSPPIRICSESLVFGGRSTDVSIERVGGAPQHRVLVATGCVLQPDDVQQTRDGDFHVVDDEDAALV